MAPIPHLNALSEDDSLKKALRRLDPWSPTINSDIASVMTLHGDGQVSFVHCVEYVRKVNQ